MTEEPHSEPPQRARRGIAWLAGAIAAAILLLAWPTVRAHLQAVAILDQLNGQPVPRLLRPIAAMPVTTRTLTVPSEGGAMAARLYTPATRPNAPGVVLVPGIHSLGVDEPRLVAFARSLAACGLRVMTPEMPGSRDYKIAPGDVTAIGDAAHWLRQTTGHRVGVMGLSFSGGLALMAAARPAYASDISTVFSVGAHDDLYRVASFYATGADPLPDGDVEREAANPYGPTVLEYEHLEDFAPAADVSALRAALRARLDENWTLEKELVSRLTPEERTEYAKLVNVAGQALPLDLSNQRHAAEMAAVSPHGNLAGIRACVYLLHGRGDNLIPFAEAEWLAQDVPQGRLVGVLISPAIGHVGTEHGAATRWDDWRLVHFLARVLERVERR